MNSFKKLALAVAIVAIVGPLVCVDWTTEAQKTSANSFQQSIQSGSNPNSVYGGYGQSSQSSFNRRTSNSLVAPVNQQRRTQQTYQSRQQTEYAKQPQYQQQEQQSSSSYEQQAEADAEPATYGAVQGSPGRDFPNYAQVPKTSFSCDGLPYDYGMYADEETGCQAYHLCYNGRKESFLCGPGTVFNQRILHCDYWYSVECGKSSQYYSSNAYMGSSQPEPGPAQASAPSPAQQRKTYQSNEAASSSINRPANTYRQQPQQQQQASFNRNTQQQQVEENY